MLEIVASVCLLTQPAQCKDIHLSFAEEETITQQQCFYFGQLELAKWSAGHPNWTVQKWKCGKARAIANI